MQEIFEKIKERLEEELEWSSTHGKYVKFREGRLSGLRTCMRIVNQVAEETNKGEISDGYHTFNELYHHRAILFSVICNSNKELAWKSRLHDTGDMYDGMFIVGIETPEGQATYHYDIEPYWDMFEVKKLQNAPKWDGHTPDEAIRRIGLLGKDINTSSNDGWIPCSERLPEVYGDTKSSDVVLVCGYDEESDYNWQAMGFYVKTEAIKRWFFAECKDTDKPIDWIDIVAWQPLPAPYKPKGWIEWE